MSRGHVEFAHAPEVVEQTVPAAGWPAGAKVRVLSMDSGTGAVSGVLRLPPGYRRHAGHFHTGTECLVLSGSLRIGEESRGVGYYEYAPARSDHAPWSTETGVELLFLVRDGRADFFSDPGTNGSEERIEHETEHMEWAVSPVPGPPEGMVLKILRHVDSTGEMTALCSSVPHYDYPMLEFHDCVEEIYMIEGDIWLGNSGLMSGGSYLWRPPFITHGPFFSRMGALMLVWVPSTLVNHVPAAPESTPEENMATFIANGGQRVIGPRAG